MCFGAGKDPCTRSQKNLPLALLPTKSADKANHTSHNNSSSMIEYPVILLTLKDDMKFE